MHVSLTFPPAAIACFAVAAAALIYILTVYLGRWRKVKKCQVRCAMRGVPQPVPMAASVVVYAQDDADALERTLECVLAQDYAPGFEIIVVNEGASEQVRQTVGRLRVAYPNLYLTFTPDGARSLSRKKLALTLGVKAAHNPVVVIIDEQTRPQSPQWLALMMAPFHDPACQVVLGVRMPDSTGDTTVGNSRRAYDYAAASVAWLSAAVAGHPYRGCGGNVAYRRQLFFDNKGFSRSLNLRYGDDDIFINEITTPTNTAVQLAPQAIPLWAMYNYKKTLAADRKGHAFTGERVPKASRRMMAAGEWMIWVVAGATVAGALCMGALNYAGWIIAAVLLLGMLIPVTITQRATLEGLYGERSRRSLLLIPLLAMTRPLRNLCVWLSTRVHRDKNYTWS